ncbi:hypothetical protein AURDEDRAFT_177070 [Auricularia subglabra TFB-10046 SS5]|uniref:Uncharacterized protein n=1 Tax=Auricularia subglabra (strain TFB-10046 / SS5) TaxID=717982 RepID=J0WPR3_AURST|nr:hypothetical protein AURDEDRAFT_177070 [Auricularia subglabra TFB-10046 SS5]
MAVRAGRMLDDGAVLDDGAKSTDWQRHAYPRQQPRRSSKHLAVVDRELPIAVRSEEVVVPDRDAPAQEEETSPAGCLAFTRLRVEQRARRPHCRCSDAMVVKPIRSDTGISNKPVAILNSFVNDIFERVAT